MNRKLEGLAKMVKEDWCVMINMTVIKCNLYQKYDGFKLI